MRGRKPKPTHLKVIAGNPGKRPLNEDGPRYDPKLLKPPRFGRASARDRTLIHLGLGHLVLNEDGVIEERLAPPRGKVPPGIEFVLKALDPACRDVDPGSRGGGYSTPFRRTMSAIRDLLVQEPGMTPSQIVTRIEHHYSNDNPADTKR